MITWRLENWIKFFGRTKALGGINVELEPNKIYGLIGPNGSGKSTLIKALTGVVKLDAGKLFRNNEEIHLASPFDAYKHGICAAYQEPALIQDLSVMENFMVSAKLKAHINHVSPSHIINDYLQLLEYFRKPLSLTTRIKNLNRGDQQIIEIVKALGFRPVLLLLDEPTSFLPSFDIEKLFNLVRSFKESTTIVFVSHRLREVVDLCDEIVVMKDGINVAKFVTKETSVEEVVTFMGGVKATRVAVAPSQSVYSEKKEPFFYANIISSKVHDVSISVVKGEILGLAGLIGHGQSEVLQIIAGLRHGSREIKLSGKRLVIRAPADAVRAGIVYISGSTSDVVLPHRPIRENISLILNARQKIFDFADVQHERVLSGLMINKFNIVCRSMDEPIRFLSGGNQQKAVLARAIAAKPNVILLDDPLKGIDAATKAEFYDQISEVAKDAAVIFFSSDVEELLPVASRILVMYEGRVVSEFSGTEMTKENILAAVLHGG